MDIIGLERNLLSKEVDTNPVTATWKST